jgi:tetratricopeptide (TPR) repeat protein
LEVKYESSGVEDPETGVQLDRLTTPLTFVDQNGVAWKAPAGMLTDGASIPDWALSITGRPNTSNVFRAAIVHDAYCQASSKASDQLYSRPWKATHQMFYDGCIACGAAPSRAVMWWAAVRLGGPRWAEDGRLLESNLSDVAFTALDLIREIIAGGQDAVSPAEIDSQIHGWEQMAATVHEHESDADSSLEEDNFEAAENSIAKAMEMLESARGRDSKSEPVLAALEGYVQTRYAKRLQAKKKYKEARAVLDKAEGSFQRAQQVKRTKDPSVLRGLGTVEFVRADLDQIQGNKAAGLRKLEKAEALMNDALRTAPKYQPARQDLRGVTTLREKMKEGGP